MHLRDSRRPVLTEPRPVRTTQGHGGPPRMRHEPNAGATSETTRKCKAIHTIHAPVHSNKVNMKGWLCRPNDIRKNPEENLTQETCLDRGSNPGRCETGAHANACSTAVDKICILKLIPQKLINLELKFCTISILKEPTSEISRKSSKNLFFCFCHNT